MTPSVLFVCLGNICRSPLAEAAFREEARRLKLDAITDSAGTGNWHIGSPPDPRAQAVALKNGVDISALRGRQVKPADFRRFTHLVAMDHDNLANLRRLAPPDATAELSLLLDHVEGRAGQALADPISAKTTALTSPGLMSRTAPARWPPSFSAAEVEAPSRRPRLAL